MRGDADTDVLQMTKLLYCCVKDLAQDIALPFYSVMFNTTHLAFQFVDPCLVHRDTLSAGEQGQAQCQGAVLLLTGPETFRLLESMGPAERGEAGPGNGAKAWVGAKARVQAGARLGAGPEAVSVHAARLVPRLKLPKLALHGPWAGGYSQEEPHLEPRQGGEPGGTAAALLGYPRAVQHYQLAASTFRDPPHAAHAAHAGAPPLTNTHQMPPSPTSTLPPDQLSYYAPVARAPSHTPLYQLGSFQPDLFLKLLAAHELTSTRPGADGAWANRASPDGRGQWAVQETSHGRGGRRSGCKGEGVFQEELGIRLQFPVGHLLPAPGTGFALGAAWDAPPASAWAAWKTASTRPDLECREVSRVPRVKSHPQTPRDLAAMCQMAWLPYLPASALLPPLPTLPPSRSYSPPSPRPSPPPQALCGPVPTPEGAALAVDCALLQLRARLRHTLPGRPG